MLRERALQFGWNSNRSRVCFDLHLHVHFALVLLLPAAQRREENVEASEEKNGQ